MTLLKAAERGASLVRRMTGSPKSPLKVVRPDWSAFDDTRISVCALGHATILMNIYGHWVLTDPALMNNVGYTLGAKKIGPKRMVPPALAVSDLPPINTVLLSHAHPDHMDFETLQALNKSADIIVPPRTADLVEKFGFKSVRELGWKHALTLKGVTFEGARVTHYGKRHAGDLRKGRGWNGYFLKAKEHSIFFGGDAAHTHFDAGLSPELSLAIFGIGAYNPYENNHATPEQAWDMAEQLNAHYFMPMHWGVFELSDEPVGEPIERLRKVAQGKTMQCTSESLGEPFVLPERT